MTAIYLDSDNFGTIDRSRFEMSLSGEPESVREKVKNRIRDIALDDIRERHGFDYSAMQTDQEKALFSALFSEALNHYKPDFLRIIANGATEQEAV